jgi:elongation factor Ts
MAGISAKDVQRLHHETGAGLMDAKRALEETNGDLDAARRWLREQGLAKSAALSGRDNPEGAVAISVLERSAAMVSLKCETDFVAKNDDFVNLLDEMTLAVAKNGPSALDAFKDEVERLRLSMRENIEIGEVVHFEFPPDHILGSYLHIQNGRGVNGVLVELEGGNENLAHEIAMHIAFARPKYVTEEEVPEEEIEQERQVAIKQAENANRPPQAIPKIVEGKIREYLTQRCLYLQPFIKNEKETIRQHLGAAKVLRFAQVVVGR